MNANGENDSEFEGLNGEITSAMSVEQLAAALHGQIPQSRMGWSGLVVGGRYIAIDFESGATLRVEQESRGLFSVREEDGRGFALLQAARTLSQALQSEGIRHSVELEDSNGVVRAVIPPDV